MMLLTTSIAQEIKTVMLYLDSPISKFRVLSALPQSGGPPPEENRTSRGVPMSELHSHARGLSYLAVALVVAFAATSPASAQT
jgi:hypothetical protein